MAEGGQTAARVLRVLETIAANQPVGTRALARLLEVDKSAMHRAVTTLTDEGWIRQTARPSRSWELTERILAVADTAHSGYDIKRRARPVLERLRDTCGETVVLITREGHRLVVADVIESNRMLRLVPPVGSLAPPEKTAAGRAIIALLEPARQAEVLGRVPDDELRRIYATTRERGYSVSDRETSEIAASIGAAIVEAGGTPRAVITLVGPSERLQRAGHDKLGRLVAAAARSLSRGVAEERAPADHD